MRWLRNIALFSVITIFVFGCGGGIALFFPLAVGNEWDMTITTRIATYVNDTLVSDTTFTHQMTMKIVGTDQTTGGVEVFVLETEFDGSIDTSYLEERDDDIYSYDSLADEDPMLALDHPLDDGKTWTSEGYTFEVIGDDDVTVPAGSFSCKKIKQTYSDMDSYIWVAEKIGQVKSEFADTTEGPPQTVIITEGKQELDDYTVE